MRFSLAACVLASTIAGAFQIPAGAAGPQADPSPSPPPAVGEPLSPNDPCTTLTAIVTRPTVTNSVCTVRPRHLSLETGYQNQSFAGTGNLTTVPQANVRLGLGGPLELEVMPPSYTRVSATPAVSGISDAGAGLKYLIGASPKLSYSTQIAATVPSGTSGISADASQFTGAFNVAYVISPAVGIATTGTFASLAQNGVHYGAFVPSIVVTATLTGTTTAFAETALFTHANGAGTPTRTQYLAGFSSDLGSFVQLDVYYAFSPTVATTKYQTVGFGLSYYR